MSERYISVSDGEYCYFLDTMDENYKTFEDFEKIEIEEAKKENIDIKEHEDDIYDFARDKYWEWVYDNYLECSYVEYILNQLVDKIDEVKSDEHQLSISFLEYKQKVAETLQQCSDKYLDIEHGDDPLRYATEVIDEIAEKLGVELE